MDGRIIALLIISLMFFALCLGSEDAKDLPTTQGETTMSSASDDTKVKTSTTYAGATNEETSLKAATTRKTSTTMISSSKGCSKCRNSNLTCGGTMKDNGTDVICTCIKPLSNGEYSSCYISRGTICTACYDGTACGKNNIKGELCICDEDVGGGMYMACFLGKPKCTQCIDGTPCGDETKSGMGCFCSPACQGAGCEYDYCELK
jgi:hypothetical protein